MGLLKSGTINELVKMKARKKTVFFLLLTALIPFLGIPVVLRLQSGLGVAGVAADQYPAAVLGVLTLFVIPLAVFMAAVDLFSGEFGDRTMRSVLLRPISRAKIFTSKLLALFTLIAAHLAVGWLASAAAAFFLPPSDGLAAGIAEAALAYAAAALPMFALAAAAVFVAQFFKNATGALAVCILLYAGAKLLVFVFPEFAAFSPAAYTDWHETWIGSAVSAGRIIPVFSFLLGCCIVFYTSGYYVFDKKEV